MPHAHDHEHDESHDHDCMDPRLASVSVGSLLLAMLFSPCLLLVPYYLQAAQHGWQGMLALSAVYVAVTLVVLVGLVLGAHAGLSQLRWGPFERRARAICGALLIAAAIAGVWLHGLGHDHGHAHDHAHDHGAHRH